MQHKIWEQICYCRDFPDESEGNITIKYFDKFKELYLIDCMQKLTEI